MHEVYSFKDPNECEAAFFGKIGFIWSQPDVNKMMRFVVVELFDVMFQVKKGQNLYGKEKLPLLKER